MRFLRRNSADNSEAAEVADDAVTVGEGVPKGHTPGKGKPTPKRREAEGRKRGPVAPPPKTTREAIRRARGNKEDRKALAAQRREQRTEQRRRMAEGDDRYLMPRDRGPVKAYVRDLVDSKRNLLGLFMPLAILVFVSLLSTSLVVQQYATLVCLVMLVAMVVEAVFNGRRVVRRVREKFPKETVGGASIGWYAFVRATQLRKLRVPKPRVTPGTAV
ncbi:DUF3043 domain-containing protein [Actinokineospora globicatena]|uniref:DUF3043 domain-containing protein n=1 Tax=Actinokineospora globicatena TaxID=103729 RepID=A0A9W6QNA0_9PSEU|nr:DUF3043 domain-containing protein [Actinokineospora globicatena]MCP2302485.1 Protein of unknown function (DUF3043) [Actinokineospora globicatena]GLW75831.1 hypothetical protein Aglo01_03130 [Actinokineospora globicatena]GLW82669.1 hypothetical protein Aglo02_03100 [Actinokineospora globicatena]GLW91614.1 hypothetical protein Aglo03_24300 [Actinokineospora globicatena]